MIRITSTGKLGTVIKRLQKAKDIIDKDEFFKEYAERGLQALKENTPVDTGKTAASWRYEIIKDENSTKINYYNDNVVGNEHYSIPVAVLLQYGHGTRGGKWVQGIDYINPAIKPIFDNMVIEIVKEMEQF